MIVIAQITMEIVDSHAVVRSLNRSHCLFIVLFHPPSTALLIYNTQFSNSRSQPGQRSGVAAAARG